MDIEHLRKIRRNRREFLSGVGTGVNGSGIPQPPAIAPGLTVWLSARQIASPPSNGGALTTWPNLVAGGNNPTQATGAKQPLYNTDAKIGAYISFDGTNHWLRVATPSLAQPITGFIVGRFNTTSAGNKAMMDAGDNVNRFKFYQSASYNQVNLTGGAALTTNSMHIYSWQLYYFVLNGVSSSLTADRQIGYRGFSNTVSGSGGASNGNGITLGANGVGTPSELCPCSISEIVMYTGVLTADQITNVLTYLRGVALPDSLVFVGDSMALGSVSSSGLSYADLVSENFKTGASAVNLGVGGKTMATMATEASGQAATYIVSGRNKNTVVVFGGTNDLQSGATGAACYANTVACCQAWRNAGYKVVVVTMLPRGAGVETNRQTLNTSIRNNYTTFADALADVGNNSVMGQAGQNADTTYYNADAVHPNNTGHGIIANTYIIPAITWL